MNWDNKVVSCYVLSVNNGEHVLVHYGGRTAIYNLPDGTYQINSISVIFDDETSVYVQYEIMVDGEPVSEIVLDKNVVAEIVINNIKA
jgi:hypothetical protein